ncbi:hypothetical protein M434DRAFT_35952 [Hypoxylon sp. CO27-5]|nr:hypothetical protein M434DRAFT_35952 [Hypoxylon sp. CO27-5]
MRRSNLRLLRLELTPRRLGDISGEKPMFNAVINRSAAMEMSPPDENFHPNVNLNAENEGQGSQYINGQSGDQIVATTSGRVYKTERQFIFYISNTAGKEIPSLFHLAQSKSFNETGSYLQEPTRANVVDWLMRQPDQTPLNLHRHQNELLRQIAQGTGQWILETEEFLAWKDI